MAKPPDYARDVPPPVGGVTYQLLRRGALWMRIGKNLAGRVDLGWPMNAYDSATVVTCVLQGNRLTTRIRRVDERAGSTPGTDLVDVVAVDDPPTTRRELLAVPPGG
ncbi:MAG: hypothetical protein F9K40_14790, partial [Kofleriaceae bacterium]